MNDDETMVADDTDDDFGDRYDDAPEEEEEEEEEESYTEARHRTYVIRGLDIRARQDVATLMQWAGRTVARQVHEAILDGRVNGSLYLSEGGLRGPVGCLLGLTAFYAGLSDHTDIPSAVRLALSGAAEDWVAYISEYDTPDDNPFSRDAAEWVAASMGA